jgi:hypothetical protein
MSQEQPNLQDFEPYQSPPQEEYYEPYGGQPQQTGYPPSTLPFPNQNSQFLQWLFNFKKESIIPLRHLWKGHETDETGNWKAIKDRKPLMNEKGITWGISLIESYINPVYITSNYSQEDLNWTMRQLGRVVYNNLCVRYQEFNLNKLDIQRVANEIISKVHAILLGARNNGYRMFLSSTHQTHEVSSTDTRQEPKGVLPTLRNFFMR